MLNPQTSGVRTLNVLNCEGSNVKISTARGYRKSKSVGLNFECALVDGSKCKSTLVNTPVQSEFPEVKPEAIFSNRCGKCLQVFANAVELFQNKSKMLNVF